MKIAIEIEIFPEPDFGRSPSQTEVQRIAERLEIIINETMQIAGIDASILATAVPA